MLGPSISWRSYCSSETIKLFPLWTPIHIWTVYPEHNVSPSPLLGNEVLQWALQGWNMGCRCWTREGYRNKFVELKYNFQNLFPFDISVSCSTSHWGKKKLLFLFPPSNPFVNFVFLDYSLFAFIFNYLYCALTSACILKVISKA